MNKNGLTLIELIAAVAIIGILAVLVSPAILEIRQMVMENSLESKINLIKNAAIEYATDNIMEVKSVTSSDVSCNNECIKHNGKIPTGNSCASSFNCDSVGIHIFVKTLIQQGYISGDSEDKTVLLNPLSDEPLNFIKVYVTFDSDSAIDRKLVAYIEDEQSLFGED